MCLHRFLICWLKPYRDIIALGLCTDLFYNIKDGNVHQCVNPLLKNYLSPFLFPLNRRKKKCARLGPVGFRSVAAGNFSLSFDKINEESENEEDEECCTTDEEGVASPLIPAMPTLKTPVSATEESYLRRFLLHHRHSPSNMLLPPLATTPMGLAESYGLPRPPFLSAIAGVSTSWAQEKCNVDIATDF